MAKTEKSSGDKISSNQRIDNRMESSTRNRMHPTNWELRGELFLNCSCTVFCPCVVSLGAYPPTEGYCHTWMAVAIDEGHFEGEDLSGLNVGLLVDIPGRMGEGNWKVAAYVDERSSQKAYNGLLQIFSGQAGGTTALFTMLVSEIIGASREKVEIVREGNKRSINIGRKISGEIEMLQGKNRDHPVMVSNTNYWMGPDVIAAKGLKSKVRDYGRVWDFSGKSAEICPIHWYGPQ
ncbi:MAG: hypothetical protein CL532_09040 [Aestuariivita sp.]|nr:hypothetical protein [Aestuariivita sp.]